MKSRERTRFSYSTVQRDTVFKENQEFFVHYESVRRIEYMRIITELEE